MTIQRVTATFRLGVVVLFSTHSGCRDTPTAADSGYEGGHGTATDTALGTLGDSSAADSADSPSGGADTGDAPDDGGETSAGTGGQVPNPCDADLVDDPENCGACGHDCLGGDCVLGACHAVELTEWFVTSAPDLGEELRASKDTVHVLRAPGCGIEFFGQPRELLAVDKVTGAEEVLFEGTIGWSYRPTDDGVVFSEYFDDPEGQLLHVPLGGGPPELLHSMGAHGRLAANDDVIVFQNASPDDPSHTVQFHAMAAGGGEPTLLLEDSTPADPELDTFGCYAAMRPLEVDDEALYVAANWQGRFLLDEDDPDGGNVCLVDLLRVPLDGGPVSTVASDQPEMVSIVLDGDFVYFSSWGSYYGTGHTIFKYDGFVARVRKDGSDLEVLVEDAGVPGQVAVDETHVYWTDSARIRRIPKQRGEIETLAPGNVGRGLVVDEDAIFYVHRASFAGDCSSYLGGGAFDAKIMRVAK